MRFPGRRFAFLSSASCFVVIASACPADPVATDTSDSSGSGDSGSTSVTPTPPDPDTGPDDTTEGPGATSDASTTAPGNTTGDTTGSDDVPTGDGPITVCGNNLIEEGEVCDLNQLGGETCQSLGFQGGQLGCLLTCDDYNLLGCFICGNEVVDIAEDCEGVVPEGMDCEALGWEAGTLACGDDCLWDESDCSICGDGIQAGPEQCDGLDLGGETCTSLGFDMGTLGCNFAECAFDYSGCSGGQYIQDFEASAMIPIEFQVDLVDPWFVDEMSQVNGVRSARSGALIAGGISNLTLAASFPAGGSVTFVHEESTAAGFDMLEFYIDGLLQMSWSGINAPATFMQAVAAGDHTFQWRFNRLGFINGGIDAVFVDDIVLDGGVPM